VLKDVLGFSAAEIAEILGTSPAAVNSALQRARGTVDERVPKPSQAELLRSLGDHRVRRIAERFATAMEMGDVEGIVSLLDGDARFAMPPYPDWAEGRENVAGSWLMPPTEPGLLRLLPVSSNGQIAFAAYRRRRPDGFFPVALDVLSVSRSGISCVVAFRNAEVFRLFGLPDHLPLAAPGSPMSGRRLDGARAVRRVPIGACASHR
jgi:hypothetical protein